ncbi:UDP-N-acetylmuramoyl-tripeptide--D-alanyl-D-alanine ligase [Actinospica robiniae]|uniref:UDP-N-acetylmuramoyl-tripeptide--D-alanyl-D- alanine ligase n=1 Tax=Actinospica robiniae TaxID=304901 RepID=UPI00040311A6|nr:UDP-N-acetylmuramoyl-tripeptide--D-alanyl-D-alanine ligase [Actinospica robiniae]
MIALTLGELARIVDGELAPGTDPAITVTGPAFLDSREIVPGGLFAAFDGEQADGHDYASSAIEAGAAAMLGSRDAGVPGVLVPDVEAALGRLAREVLLRLTGTTVIALTGSSGKTSTKDMLGQVLSGHGPTVFTEGSFNNEKGLPLTVLRADQDTKFLVLEMGARGIGHIKYLCELAPPRVGLVLNIGSAHAGEFGSKEQTALAKGELIEALPPEGLAVLNADDPYVAEMEVRTVAETITFGEHPSARVRAEDVELDQNGCPSFTLVLSAADASLSRAEPDLADAASARVALQVVGEHHVSNALAVAAVCLGVGMSVPEVAAGLAAARALSGGRMAVTARPDGVVVIDDAYNANPESVRAGLKALVTLARSRPGARSWAVLGHMAELGDRSVEEHDAIGRLAVRLRIDRLVAVGAEAAMIHAGAGHEGSGGQETTLVADSDEAIALLREQLRPGDVVLVKASHSVGLRRVARALLEDPQ